MFFLIEFVGERSGRQLCRHGHRVQREGPERFKFECQLRYDDGINYKMGTNIKDLNLTVAVDGTTNT